MAPWYQKRSIESIGSDAFGSMGFHGLNISTGSSGGKSQRPRTDAERNDDRIQLGEINQFFLYVRSWVKHTVLERLHSSRLGLSKTDETDVWHVMLFKPNEVALNWS